jgi:hypothetical protein
MVTLLHAPNRMVTTEERRGEEIRGDKISESFTNNRE